MSETPDAAPARGAKTRKSIGSGRSGRVRAALRRALDEARESGRMSTEHEIRGALAEKYAAIVDDAARDGEGSKLLAAGQRLTDLLDTLPIRETHGGGAGDGSSGGGDNVRDLFEAGPTMGDAAHT